MENGLAKLTGTTVLALLIFSATAASVAYAQPEKIGGSAASGEPVWATVNAAAQGNYPGGNEEFTVFVVNSGLPPDGNLTIQNMTLSTSAWSQGNSNYGIGLPTTLAPENAAGFTIFLQIPGDYTQSNFTANLAVDTQLWNGTVNVPIKLTGSVVVYMLAQSSQSSGQSGRTTITVTGTQSGAASTTLLAAGVAIPSLVAVILLALLVQARGRSKRTGT